MRITRRLYTLQKKYAIMVQALPLGKKYQVRKGIGRTGDRLESSRLCKAETMKRIGYLFGDICTLENLYLAHLNASKGKRNRKEVQRFGADLQANIYQIQQELLQHTYTTGKYSVFIKYELKRREIYKLPYCDRVVQWAIMQILESIWHKCFNADTYACVKGRGIHSLLRKLRRDLYKAPDGTRYCFKMDVKRFYPSITHSVLKDVVRQKIKDPDLLWLIDDIIDSADGVPIGNYISQFFTNLYLSELDHQIKEVLKVRYYYRYADDIVVLAADKRYLNGVQIYINDYLENDRLLHIKSNYQIFPVESRGIDFVGYVTWHGYCLARKHNKKALRRTVAALRKKGHTSKEIRLMLASRLGFMYHCNSVNLLRKLDMKDWKEVDKKGNGGLTGSKYPIDAILNREIHLQAAKVEPSKRNDGNCLTIQYEVYEQLHDKDGGLLWNDEARTQPVMGWVQHISFTGSTNLQHQLDGLDLSEPVRCKIIKQPCEHGRCFYKFTSVTE